MKRPSLFVAMVCAICSMVSTLSVAQENAKQDESLPDFDADIKVGDKQEPAPPQRSAHRATIKMNPNVFGYFAYGLFHYSGVLESSGTGFLAGGGYEINQNVAVEAGYSTSESSSDNNCTKYIYITSGSTCPQESISTSLLHVVVVGNLPFQSQDKDELIVKLGLANTSVSYSSTYTPCALWVVCSTPITGSGSATKTNLMYGVGWQGGLGSNLKFRLLYEYFGEIKLNATYSDNSSKTYNIRVGSFSMGLNFKF